MDIIITIVLFIIGIFLLMKCGDLLVDVCLKFSKITGISEIIIGATMVSVATALPELFVSVIAAGKGSNGLAVGNSIGTIISNGCMVLGILLSFGKANYSSQKRDVKLLFPIIFSVLFLAFALDLKVSFIESIFLVICFTVFFIYNLLEAKKDVKAYNQTFYNEKDLNIVKESNKNISVNDDKFEEKVNKKDPSNKKKLQKRASSRKNQILLLILYFILGAGGIVLGAELLVNSATKIAGFLGVSEEIIGFTIVAIGTSIPELITTINSLKKKNYNLAIGNITGANIINLTLILGLSGIVGGEGLLVSKVSLSIYIPMVILMSMVISLPLFIKNKSNKWQGFTLLGLYVLYFTSLIVMALI